MRAASVPRTAMSRHGPLAILFAACLHGCVVVPTTTTVYDPDCQIAAKHMQLESVQLGTLGHCHGNECGAILVAIGATAAASAVVSGSIVIVGNVVYWFEKQGSCKRAN
jgi:hypothetical protein